MGTRKYQRAILAADARKAEVSESKYVAYAWHQKQIGKYGAERRKKNQIRSTRPHRTWKELFLAVFGKEARK